MALVEFKAAASALLSRLRWANMAGITFGGQRDLYQILGYKRTLGYWDYRDRYARDGVAKAVVDAYPNATWRGGVEVFEDEDPEKDTEFEKAFKELDDQLSEQTGMGFWQTCQQVDILAGLSTYAVLFIGVSGSSNLLDELPKGERLLFLKPFSGGGGPDARISGSRTEAFDAAVRVAKYDVDPQSERFGEPSSYYIRSQTPGSSFLNFEVHWSRVIHVAEGCLEDNVFGIPTLECVFNLFDDLAKITGGGSEAFWLRANQGLHLDVDKDMGMPGQTSAGLSQPEREALKDKAEELQHQLQRVLVTRGVTATQLGSDVANFGQSGDFLLKLIAGASRIPMRILTGSEMGTLASEQDAANFDSRVQDRRTGYAGPKIVRRTIDRLIAYGYLPKPSKYEVGWPVEENMDEVGKADYAVKLATVNKTMGVITFTDDEVRDMAFNMKPLTSEQKQPVAAPVRESAVLPAGPDAMNPDAQQLKAALVALEAAIEEGDAGAVSRIIGLTHAYATTQVTLLGEPADALFALAASIPDADLAEKGRETDPHVTVKYGLIDPNAMKLQGVLAYRGPAELQFGTTGYFETPDYDCVHARVVGGNLDILNRAIADGMECAPSDHEDYIPHATVAYVKPGLGSKYAGRLDLDGMHVESNTITLVTVDDERIEVRLA